jgi:hypothetical protein
MIRYKVLVAILLFRMQYQSHTLLSTHIGMGRDKDKERLLKELQQTLDQLTLNVQQLNQNMESVIALGRDTFPLSHTWTGFAQTWSGNDHDRDQVQ